MAGRPLPSENEVEFLAESIFWNSDVEITKAKYAETRSAYLSRDHVTPTTRIVHPDPLVESVRYQICEGELLQNFARPRPIRRTAEKPVEIYILTNVPIPIPVDQLTTWKEMKPTNKFAVAEARGVLLENAVDMAAAYPDLFANGQAARNAKRAERSVQIPYKDSLIGKLHTPLATARYQLPGAGQKPKTAFFDPQQIPDIRAWLTGYLGELRLCEVGSPRVAVAATDDLAEWQSGTMPRSIVAAVVRVQRSCAISQEELAQHCGVSRPHLANVLQGRFGLAKAAAAKVKAFLADPPVVQPNLI